jgi:hypothetical protein
VLEAFLVRNASLIIAALVLASSMSAQQPRAAGGASGFFRQAPVVTGPAPHFKDGTPDLGGVWIGGGSSSGDITKGLKPGEEVIMLPSAQKIYKERLAKDDPEALCLPFGVPRSAPYPLRILQTPTHYFIVYEGNIHSFRQIFMDGRKHPADPNPTWYGHSIGHWEGETLVVDTVGFNDKFWFDYLGHPHTEQLHTIERYTRVDKGTINMEVTIDDPGAYAKPFTTIGKARLQPADDELMEYICQENDRDRGHYSGPPRLPTEGLTEPLRTPDSK